MAEILRFCDPNSSVGGDGTTSALTGANRAYVSLNAWEAATQQDLVAGGNTARVVCSSDDAGSTHAADTTAVTIDGWTTGASNYITIEAASSHGGKWNAAIYRLAPAIEYGNSLLFNEDYVRIIGLQIENTHTGAYVRVLRVTTVAGVCHISKCIIRKAGTSTSVVGIFLYGISSASTILIWNNLVYDFAGTSNIGISSDYPATNTKVVLYNNTVYNCKTGVWIVGTTTSYIKNNLINVSGTENYHIQFGTQYTGNNVSSDTTSPDAAFRSKTATYVDTVGKDFHLDASDTNAKDAGADLSADGQLSFSDDIDGVARTGTWDIGADEYVASGPSDTPRTPTIGSLAAAGVASRNDRGIFTPTEVNIA